jgi:glycopeptide antibiotics resistance protein
MGSRRGSTTWAARTALVAYLLLPASLTLTSAPATGALQGFHEALRSIVQYLTFTDVQVSLREAEALANVLMFIPIGLLLPLALPRAYLSALLLLAVAGSLAIETTQYLALPDRVPSLLDVVMNSVGAAAGLVPGGDLRRMAAADRHAAEAR